MRLIEIPLKRGYTQYKQIRDILFDEIPYAVLNCEFVEFESPRYDHLPAVTCFGFFFFWDSDYIPQLLEKYTVSPPSNKTSVEITNNKLDKIFD